MVKHHEIKAILKNNDFEVVEQSKDPHGINYGIYRHILDGNKFQGLTINLYHDCIAIYIANVVWKNKKHIMEHMNKFYFNEVTDVKELCELIAIHANLRLDYN